MRGTVNRIEVERWGGEQARECRAGSLNPSKTSTLHEQLSKPASALFFISFHGVPSHAVAFLGYGTIRIWLRKASSPLCSGQKN